MFACILMIMIIAFMFICPLSGFWFFSAAENGFDTLGIASLELGAISVIVYTYYIYITYELEKHLSCYRFPSIANLEMCDDAIMVAWYPVVNCPYTTYSTDTIYQCYQYEMFPTTRDLLKHGDAGCMRALAVKGAAAFLFSTPVHVSRRRIVGSWIIALRGGCCVSDIAKKLGSAVVWALRSIKSCFWLIE